MDKKLTIAVPAYNRASYLYSLLDSILAQTVLPSEVLIIEDNSRERVLIREIASCYCARFVKKDIAFNYIENIDNLGYDGNLRKLIRMASCDFVMILGNDDELTDNAVAMVISYVKMYPSSFYSRSIYQLKTIEHKDKLLIDFSRNLTLQSESVKDLGFLFGLCGVVSGLVFERGPCILAETDEFDGTLYYQFHLAMVCNAHRGSSYIPHPLVVGRADLAPDFGNSIREKGFTPGRYTAEARIKMAGGLLQIAEAHNISPSKHFSLVQEINIRQSIHVFEMLTGLGRREYLRLMVGFWNMGLYLHPVPIGLWCINLVFGSTALDSWLRIKEILRSTLQSVGMQRYLRAKVEGNS